MNDGKLIENFKNGDISALGALVQKWTCDRLCQACAISFPDEEKFAAFIKGKLETKRKASG
jgi:hypothetical protein